MKRLKVMFAFTLQEALIVLGIIGVLAVLSVVGVTNAKPDENIIMFRHSYGTILKIVRNLMNDKVLYPNATVLASTELTKLSLLDSIFIKLNMYTTDVNAKGKTCLSYYSITNGDCVDGHVKCKTGYYNYRYYNCYLPEAECYSDSYNYYTCVNGKINCYDGYYKVPWSGTCVANDSDGTECTESSTIKNGYCKKGYIYCDDGYARDSSTCSTISSKCPDDKQVFTVFENHSYCMRGVHYCDDMYGYFLNELNECILGECDSSSYNRSNAKCVDNELICNTGYYKATTVSTGITSWSCKAVPKNTSSGTTTSSSGSSSGSSGSSSSSSGSSSSSSSGGSSTGSSSGGVGTSSSESSSGTSSSGQSTSLDNDNDNNSSGGGLSSLFNNVVNFDSLATFVFGKGFSDTEITSEMIQKYPYLASATPSTKFGYSFLSMLNPVEKSVSGTTFTFTTPDGMYWKLEDHFNDEGEKYAVITVQPDGKTNSACYYNATTCLAPNKFTFFIKKSGLVHLRLGEATNSADDPMACSYARYIHVMKNSKIPTDSAKNTCFK